ncbi:hypothetical protein [Rhodopirellula sp. MGV]|uniref:hypothetical protein n=1 Tax=Rhodopirellula sp. MGV TaxID=2023130 RepID=UPI000B9731FB|nr:hypothetical protein [Rhodopirellula sp. MGV]OYP34130.1 hypothetical protein CGZ80_15835 [Rhodopirellula sp. MGV]PNY33568.1 hypothetical protein C2E31_27565 [Rhodopirellula baltica]
MANSNFNSALRDSVVTHLVAAIEATPFRQSPFPHLSVSGFFPADVYATLLESLPPPSHYHPFSYSKHHNTEGDSNRKRFCLDQVSLDSLSGGLREFWCSVRSALGSVELKRAVFEKLSSGLAYRYGCSQSEAAALPGFALPELFHETGGYCIKPHPDTRKKVVTMQIALPDSEDRRDLGTEFYRRSTNPMAWLREPKGFEIVKRMPFVPNTAYAFVVLNTMRLKSWHGRTTLPVESPIRNSLLNIWYEKAENGNQEIVRENEANDTDSRLVA